ncbi:hypothetical protein CAOG_08955 [Capsaspora owczarzaki ATCC 30864]|uniref:Uncharacterized protein n=1 Tax=Capsaspora owczarzaki (strain ATCC 30864) TaxID=595528 RepID=A0A0D2UL19_CAPO3|nr:hypothetical protein CAOG_08955 [Capsaspora owczarzaki ATCC 30864]KJE95791.1 hypothetical protein CAOG_008955 [Capsaspora owczarzaki ATCC 30864]|eukprot:XP_011270626.1 hypothetical protein CAOG_08955 [Capsaspora owczarzaki ATCC 30864]
MSKMMMKKKAGNLRAQEELFQQMQALSSSNDEADVDFFSAAPAAPQMQMQMQMPVQQQRNAVRRMNSITMNNLAGPVATPSALLPFGHAQPQDANGSVAVQQSHQAALSSILDETQLTLADGKTDKGLATVPISAIMRLMDAAAAQQKETPPKRNTILSVEMEGQTTNSHHARFVCKFKIMVFAEDYTATKILSQSVALESATILREDLDAGLDENGQPIERSQPTADDAAQASRELDAAQQPCVLLLDAHHALASFRSGVYTVTVVALAPFATARETGLRLQVPPASRRELRFTVVAQSPLELEAAIAVHPCLRYENIEPPADVRGTTMKFSIPPTSSWLNVQWLRQFDDDPSATTTTTPKAAAPAPVAQALPLHATVDQQHLVAVGESLVLVTSQLEYTILNGSMAVFELCLDADLRIVNVDTASNGVLRKWDTTTVHPDDPSYSEFDVAAGDAAEPSTAVAKGKKRGLPRQILKVLLEYGVEDKFELRVTAEKQLPATSCKFVVPTFRHVRGPVSREKGTLAVEATTSVEVEQVPGGAVGVGLLDVAELPASLKTRAANPILLAYKFLTPTYEIELDVKKHADVDVLMASIDSAQFDATVTDEGKTMYRLAFEIRNTQKQYLRITLPADGEVWSTTVGDKAVKPARDNLTGELLIPLQKLGGPEDEPSRGALDVSGATSDPAGYTSFSVEFMYVRHPRAGDSAAMPDPKQGKAGESGLAAPSSTLSMTRRGLGAQPSAPVPALSPMQRAGELVLQFPPVDVPINILQVSCWLPQDYVYGEFEGDIKEVHRFSRVSKISQPRSKPSRAKKDSKMDYQMDKMKKGGGLGSLSFGGKRKGIVPVKVDMVKSGTEFKFEKLLVVHQPIRLAVEYLKQSKKGRRELDAKCVIS